MKRPRRAEIAAFHPLLGALGRSPRGASGLPKSSPATPEIARGSWKSVGNGFTVSSSRSKKDHWFRRFWMNKAELIDVLTEKLGSDRRQATAAVENVVDTIVRAVHKGDSVTITGFGVFEQRRRAARVARNPRTGETVKVKPTSVPAFRPGAQFKAVVSGAQRLPSEGPAVKRRSGGRGGGSREEARQADGRQEGRQAGSREEGREADGRQEGSEADGRQEGREADGRQEGSEAGGRQEGSEAHRRQEGSGAQSGHQARSQEGPGQARPQVVQRRLTAAGESTRGG